MKWFNNIFDIDTLNLRYKELCKLYHPDVNPDGANKFKEIQVEYNEIKIYMKISEALSVSTAKTVKEKASKIHLSREDKNDLIDFAGDIIGKSIDIGRRILKNNMK